jgi:D-amino-acid dehydrogenase
MMKDALPDLAPLPESQRKHVAIIGAGFIGLCSALWLQRAGHHVTLIDRDPPLESASYRGACSYGNACTVAPHGVVPVATPGIVWQVPGMLLNPLGPLAIRWRYLPRLAPWLLAFLSSSRRHEVDRISAVLASLLDQADAAWRPLLSQARAESLRRDYGCLYLYKNEAQYRAAEYGNDLRERRGVGVDRIGKAEIRDLEPNLAPLYERGVLFRDAYTFASPRQLALALAREIIAHGGQFIRDDVGRIEAQRADVTLRLTSSALTVDHCLVAAGAHSRKFTRQLGDRVLLDTERGYHVLYPQAGNLLTRPVCYPEHGFYMTPMADGLRAVGTVELGGLVAPLNSRRTAIIRKVVAQLLPGAGQGTDEWLGLRPSMPDSLPVIGHSPRSNYITYAFGHGHLGLTLGAVTGRCVAQLISGGSPEIDMAPLRPERFCRAAALLLPISRRSCLEEVHLRRANEAGNEWRGGMAMHVQGRARAMS